MAAVCSFVDEWPRYQAVTCSSSFQENKTMEEAWVDARYNPEIDPLPLRGKVSLLGTSYFLPQDKQALTKEIQSKLWFSYRKNFKNIGGTSFTGDHGWGCTHRCGQMLLAHALICKHLGRDWSKNFNPSDRTYQKILRKFLDKRDSEYSIHMLALQGTDLGRMVGQWFGPNNVAHAIKKLAAHDKWSKLAVYVAMDMLVVIDDMKRLCREKRDAPTPPIEVTTLDGVAVKCPASTSAMRQSFSFPDQATILQALASKEKASTLSPSRTTQHENSLYASQSYDMLETTPKSSLPVEPAERNGDDADELRSLLIFIPLRLGQDKFNPEYSEALKACLGLPQSVGIVGGKPRHALWIIGCHENSLLYLDPHTIQPTVPAPAPTSPNEIICDRTYHCDQADRMPLADLDPSLALGFFCKTEEDIDDLCCRLQKDVLSKMSCMFELTLHRPKYWGPPDPFVQSTQEPFVLVKDEDAPEDEEFEMVDWPYSTKDSR